MPTERFHRLNAQKKDKFINAFLYEFSHSTYEHASITAVVKSLGIAKGSVYQYFSDKLDLFLFLKEHCEKTKMEYILHINRDEHEDFWSYYRALYSEGIKFDLEHPLESRFLYNISLNENSPMLRGMLKTWNKKAVEMMKVMLQAEIDRGQLRKDVSLEAMSHFIIAVSASIAEYMQSKNASIFSENMSSDKPLLSGNEEILMQSVDEYIKLLKDAFK